MTEDFQLVIPAYNEALSLPALAARAVEAAQDDGWTPGSFRLVIVNNGSTDDSAAVLRELAQGPLGPWLQVVAVAQNKGYGDGIWQGLRATTAPYIGWTHADEQCDPKDAFDALRKLRAAGDNENLIVKGCRHNRGPFDYLWSRGFELAVLLILRVRLFEINAQPKVFPRALLDEITDPPHDFSFDLYTLYRARQAGWRMDTIPVIFAPRAHGKSRWAFSWRSRWATALRTFGYIRTLSKKDQAARAR